MQQWVGGWRGRIGGSGGGGGGGGGKGGNELLPEALDDVLVTFLFFICCGNCFSFWLLFLIFFCFRNIAKSYEDGP